MRHWFVPFTCVGLARLALALVLLGALAGCRRAPPPPLPSVQTTDAAAREPVCISAAAAAAHITSWLEAQNGGNLAAYQALYIQPFLGIRRSGAKVVKYDYPGWQKDRERIFKKPQHVEVTGLEVVAATTERATVRFTQEWSSGNYRDSGVKELVLRQTPDGLRIAREELLQSTVLPSEAQGRYLPLVEGDVLLAKDAPAAWGQGKPQGKPHRPGWLAGEIEVTYRRLRPEKVPANLLGWQGRAVHLFGLGGQVCEATIAELLPASALYSDGSIDADPETGESLADRETGQAEWEAGRKLLIGRLAVTRGHCKDAVFARAADLPLPPIAKFEVAPPPWRAVAQRLFRKQSPYAAIQAHWLDFLQGEGLDPALRENKDKFPWLHKHWDGPDKPLDKWPGEVMVARHPLRDSKLLSVVAQQVVDSDNLIGIMWAVWEATGDPATPRTVLINQPARSRSTGPLAVVDLDGDGRLEFLNRYGLLSASPKEPQAYNVPDYLNLPKVFSCYDGEEGWDDELGGPRKNKTSF